MSLVPSHSGGLRWYQWLLVPFALPAALVVILPLGALALLAIPYYAVFPDHHPHVVDFGGSPRQRELLARWRRRNQQLGIIGRIAVALGGRRRRRRAHVCRHIQA
jgi:hypothetical protein